MKRALLSLMGILCAVSPFTAFGHAAPVEYAPQESAIIDRLPAEATIRFSERIEPKASGAKLYLPGGWQPDDRGAAFVDRSDPYLLHIPLVHGGTGSYVISWDVISADDGHFTRGAFSFAVGAPSGAQELSQYQVTHTTSVPEGLSIWMELTGEAFLLGALLLLIVLRPLRSSCAPAALASIGKRLGIVVWSGIALLLCGGAAYLCVEASEFAAATGDGFGASLGSFLGTAAGSFTAYRLLISVIVAIVFALCGARLMRSEKRGTAEWILISLVLLMALLRARVSHAAASMFHPWLSIAFNFVHLLAKDGWVGLVIAFAFCIAPVVDRSKKQSLLLQAASRLSMVLMMCLGVGGVTGVYVIWLHLKSLSNLTLTHWGMQCLVLGIFGLLLLVVRLFQQLFLLPAVAGLRERKKEDKAMLPYALLTEAMVGLGVLLLSAFLIITTPPQSDRQFYHAEAQSDDATVEFGENPFDAQSYFVSVAGGAPVTAMTVTLQNQEAGIGPIVAAVTQRAKGEFVFPVSSLTPAGEWTVSVTGTRPGTLDAVGTFHLRTPDQLRHPGEENARRLGSDDLFWAIIALTIVVAAVVLYRRARLLLERPGQATKDPTVSLSVTRGLTVTLLLIDAAALFLFGYQLQAHGHGGFQQECQKNGHLWHESVPMRDGKILSPIAVMGCMTGMGAGQYHFGDRSEYAYFARPAFAVADFKADPPPAVGTPTTLTFTIKDQDGGPVRDLVLQHDRILHVIIVGQDLETFAHVHPEDLGPVTAEAIAHSTFSVRYAFPHPGRYLIGVDFTERAQDFEQTFYVDVPGNAPAASSIDLSRVQTADGDTVTLIAPQTITAKQFQTLRFHVERDEQPATDLEPYLAAPMHLAIVRDDQRSFQHSHAELPQGFWDRLLNPRDPKAKHTHQALPERFGPDLLAYVQFPASGTYAVFGEYRHDGKVRRVRFEVEVR